MRIDFSEFGTELKKLLREIGGGAQALEGAVDAICSRGYYSDFSQAIMAGDSLTEIFKRRGFTDESPILQLVAQRINELAIKMLPGLNDEDEEDSGIRVIKKRAREPEETPEAEAPKRGKVEEPPVVIQQPIAIPLNPWVGGLEDEEKAPSKSPESSPRKERPEARETRSVERLLLPEEGWNSTLSQRLLSEYLQPGRKSR